MSFPLSPTHFGAVNLSPEESAAKLQQAKALIPRLVEMTESTTGWSLVKETNGIQIFKQSSSASQNGIQLFRSVTVRPCRVSIDSGFGDQLVMETTAQLKGIYPQFDPNFIDGQVLTVLERAGMSLVSIKWCAFRTSPVTWHRDFVYIDCIEPNFSDSRGTRCAVVAVASISVPECPALPSQYRSVRGDILCSGYVTRQLTPDTCEIHFVAQVDPKGWLPAWVVNAAAVDQAMNLIRIRDRAEAFQAALVAEGGVSGGAGGPVPPSPPPLLTPVPTGKPLTLLDVADRISLFQRITWEGSERVYGRLELPPYSSLLPPVASTVHLSNGHSPLVLVCGPSQLRKASSLLSKLLCGPPRPNKHALRCKLANALLCDTRRLAGLSTAGQPQASALLRLSLFNPKSPAHVFRGTWENVFGFASSVHPELSSLLPPFLPLVKGTPFDQLQSQWQRAHGVVVDFSVGAQNSALHMSAGRLKGLSSPTPGDVRFFFYCSLHIGSTFVGDGFLYDSMGKPTGEEWLAQNAPLVFGKDVLVAHIPLRALLPDPDEPVDLFATPGFPNGKSRASLKVKRTSAGAVVGDDDEEPPFSLLTDETTVDRRLSYKPVAGPSVWPITAAAVVAVATIAVYFARRRQ